MTVNQNKSKMQNFRRNLAAFACLIVGVASFALSYVALRDVAVELGAVPSYLGWLVPIVIDGGIICGSAVLWSLSKEQGSRPVFPFIFVGSMVIMSVIVNVAHAGDSMLAKVIAALPPLILLGTLELVADQSRRAQKTEQEEKIKAELAVKELQKQTSLDEQNELLALKQELENKTKILSEKETIIQNFEEKSIEEVPETAPKTINNTENVKKTTRAPSTRKAPVKTETKARATTTKKVEEVKPVVRTRKTSIKAPEKINEVTSETKINSELNSDAELEKSIESLVNVNTPEIKKENVRKTIRPVRVAATEPEDF